MRRTRSSLAALAVASSVLLGLPTAALAAPATPAEPSAAPAAEPTAAAEATTAAEPTGTAPSSPEPDAAPSSAAPGSAAPTETPAPVGTTDPAATPAPTSDAAAADVSAAALPGVPVQLLSINDLHGRFAPQSGSDGLLADPYTTPGATPVPTLSVGGLQHMSVVLDALRADFEAITSTAGSPVAADTNSLFVSIGDNVSASPFESAFFGDEPTVEMLDSLGLDVSAVGNHEFDRGLADLLRTSAATDDFERDQGTLVEACPTTLGGEPFVPGEDGCFDAPAGAPAFDGAQFPLLAANVTYTAGPNAGETILPPYEVFDVADPAGGPDLQVGVVGVVTTTTPSQVVPTGVANLTFGDEVAALDRYSAELHTQGVDAVIGLVHEGGRQSSVPPPATNGFLDCAGDLAGQRIGDIAADTSPLVDVLLTGHSHNPYLCVLEDPAGQPRLVTQAGFYGKAITDLRFLIDPATGEIDRASVEAANVPVVRSAGSDADLAAASDGWLALAATEGDVAVGTITTDITRNPGQESSLGNLVADSQLAGLRADPLYGGPVIAFMNPGGLRTDLSYAPDGKVTYREVFNVQPFSNFVNALTMTGAQIHELLEQQFANPAGRNTTQLLSTSAGFSYTYDPTAEYGKHVNPCSITLDGKVLDPAASYRVAANSFLTPGGDGFTAFTKGTDLVPGPLDADLFRAYITANSPVAPPATGRLTVSEEPFVCAAPIVVPPVETPVPPVETPAPPVETPAPPVGDPAPPVVQPVVHPRPISGGGDELAYTGAPIGEMVGFAGALLAGGVALTAAGYRRRRGLAD